MPSLLTVLFLVVFTVGVYYVPNVIGAALYYGGGLMIKALGFCGSLLGGTITGAIKSIVYSVLFMLPDWFTGTMLYVWPIISAVAVYIWEKNRQARAEERDSVGGVWLERLAIFFAVTVIGVFLSVAMVPGQFVITGWISLIQRILAPFADEFNWASMAAIVASFQIIQFFVTSEFR